MKFLIVFFFSLLLLSCNNPKNNSVKHVNDSLTVVKEAKVEALPVYDKSVIKNNICHFKSIKLDTIVGTFHISYQIQDNDQVITTYGESDRNGLDTLYYADRDVVVNISKGEKKILSGRKIEKSDFGSFISKKEMPNYSICYFEIEKVNRMGVVFSISLCIPDTDVCYWFELLVTNKGQLEIKEVIEEESEM